MTKRVAFYIRVSTDGQTTENQRRELTQAAEDRGWIITEVYEDAGVSGAKGRDKRPGFDAMLKAAQRKKFDILAAWSVDRLGRSLIDLLTMLSNLQETGRDLFLLRQNIDTTTPSGRAMFGMMGVFAEFERAMIKERVHSGLATAKAKGVKLGRPMIDAEIEDKIRGSLLQGIGINRVARIHDVGNGTVMRIRAEMEIPA